MKQANSSTATKAAVTSGATDAPPASADAAAATQSPTAAKSADAPKVAAPITPIPFGDEHADAIKTFDSSVTSHAKADGKHGTNERCVAAQMAISAMAAVEGAPAKIVSAAKKAEKWVAEKIG